MNTESFNRMLKAIALAAMLIATMLLATGCIETPWGSFGIGL
jgi:hypothetical protein